MQLVVNDKVFTPPKGYYGTMYLDGYEPWEILEAGRNDMLEDYNYQRKKEEEIQKRLEVLIGDK